MMRQFHFAVFLCLVFDAAACASGDDGAIWLARDGRALCTIVRGTGNQYASERLRRWFKEDCGAEVEAFRDAPAKNESRCLLIVGDASSNPLLARVAEANRLDISNESLTEQGYVAKTVKYDGIDCVLLAGGGADGVLYAISDFMNWRAIAENGNARVEVLDAVEKPQLKYRWFWNWDHRMDWGGAGRVGTEMGGGGTFSKKPEAFLEDSKRCVDFMADHKFNGLILWGFLRDTHGGIEASKELCRYAAERRVRILPGVGTSGYAGYYFEGKHEYNADSWLAEHPELRAVGKDGKPENVPCPSKRQNQEWLDKGARWLFNTFEIGGVNLEMGDFQVCYCDDCKKARAGIDSDEPDYYKDMAISHSVTLRTMRTLAPEAWLSYATYTGYKAEMMTSPPKFISIIPDDSICQWTLTGMARKWPGDVKPMARHNIGYLHWCNRSTKTENDFYLKEVKDICVRAADAGFEGLDTYGELSAEAPNVELFYLAWEAFLWDPQMSVETFVEERLSRLYGGVATARALLDIVPLIRAKGERKDAQNVARAREIAVRARDEASPGGQQRWKRLIGYLDSLGEAR